MKAESAAIRDAIRETAAEVWSRGTTGPAAFLKAFTDRHPVDTEDLRYGFEQWLVAEGRQALKRMGKEADRAAGSPQLELPMDLARLDIPMSLQVSRGWVPLWEAGADDLEAYILVLRSNTEACIRRLTEFLQLVKVVKPLLDTNPAWRTGDALRWLAAQERNAA
jgi:hypothetical protein